MPAFASSVRSRVLALPFGQTLQSHVLALRFGQTLGSRMLARPSSCGAVVAALSLAASHAHADPATPASPAIVLPPPPEPILFDVGVRVGGSGRLGDSSSLPIASRGGATVAVGVAIAPSPRYAVGIAYEHGELGTEHGEGDAAILDLDRSMDSLWASVRVSLFRNDRFMLGVLLGPGLVWQHVHASAIVFGGTEGRPDTFACTETSGPGLGLRAGVGAEVKLGGGFFFSLDALIDELRLASDLLGTCAPGAGSTAVLGARAGFAYRFDVSRIVR
jgi:hypothetical protein